MTLGQSSNDFGPVEYIDGKCSKYEDVTLEYAHEDLTPGEYIAFIEIDWCQDKLKDYVFNTYSQSDKVSLELIKPTDLEFDFLAEILKSCARKQSQRKTYEDKDEPSIFRCLSITDSKAEYGYIYYQNDAE